MLLGRCPVRRLPIGEQQLVDAPRRMPGDDFYQHITQVRFSGSMLFILQVSMSVARTAQCSPPPSEPAKR